jgi:hypothetical protein
MENNLMVYERGFYKTIGSVSGEVLTSRLGGFEFPFTKIKANRLPFVNDDILGRICDDPVIGAFQNIGEDPKVELATAINCGPLWYKPVSTGQK